MQSKKELIYNCIHNLKTVSYPFSFWTHLSAVDEDPLELARQTYAFYKTYDVDIIKTMNNGLYSVIDYGCKIDSSDVLRGGVSKVVATPINCIEDFKNIEFKHLEDMPTFNREIESFLYLKKLLKDDDVPVLFTIFSPLTTLNKLCQGKILDYIKNNDTTLIKRALQNITASTVELVKRVNELGAAGIYFATQLSNYSVCDESVYVEYGKYYDIQVLNASDGFADTIHCHGDSIMFDILKDYPIDIFNWHAYESKPELKDALNVNKTLMCGILREDITNKNLNNVYRQIDETVSVCKGHSHIISPGCVIRYPLDKHTLLAIKNYIRNIDVDH